jgi:hypothetical protein
MSPAASPQSAHQPSPASTGISRLAAQLEALPDLSMAELRAEWRRRFRSPPPDRLSRDLLMRGIAYKVQERRTVAWAGPHCASSRRLPSSSLPGMDSGLTPTAR